ncbi:MAG TPA: hypothetical protein VG097_09740 [Gemmata sp.]|nr:hypothetical protein [Gemmata sp.]
MNLLFGEGSLLAEIAALITAFAGLIAAIVAWRKLFKEQQKRTDAEAMQEEAQAKQVEEYQQRLEAEKREATEHKQRIEAEKRQRELKEDIAQLEQSLAQIQELRAFHGEAMDEKIIAIVNGLIVKVDKLTKAVNQLQQDLDELKKGDDIVDIVLPPPPPPSNFQELLIGSDKTSETAQKLIKTGVLSEPLKKLRVAMSKRGIVPGTKEMVVWNNGLEQMPVIILGKGTKHHRVGPVISFVSSWSGTAIAVNFRSTSACGPRIRWRSGSGPPSST